MPDPSIQPPYLDPSAYPDYLDMQRKQMLAQMLMQNTQQSTQTPSDWNQMKLVPRRSPLQGISTLASALMAGKAMQGSQQAQQKYFQNIYGGGQQTPSMPQNTAPGQQGQAQQQQNPLIPPGMGQGTAQQILGMMGPEKYAESMIAPNFKPDEFRAKLRAAGIDPDSAIGHQLVQNSIAKANYIPPTEVRKENLAIDPITHQPIAYNPAVPEGTFPSFGPNGMPSKVNEIPGSTDARQNIAKATTAGTQSQTPIKLGTDENGKDIYGFPSPPALNSSGPAQKYFNNATAPGTTASPANIQSQKSGAEAGQSYAAELSKNATGATEVRRSLSELKNLSQQASPGASNDAKAKLGAFMIAAGADPDNVARWTGVDTGALQAAQKQTATLAVNSIHSMTSRGTNFDLDTFMRNNPNLNMADPAAFARVADYMNNKASQDIAKQKDFAQWKKNSGVTPDDWETQHTAHWLDQQNQAIDKGQSNSAKPGSKAATLAELQAEARKRGLIK